MKKGRCYKKNSSHFSQYTSKRGQVTIFIIIGIIVVVGIIIAILFMGDADVEAPTDLGPQAWVEGCVKDVVEKSVNKMLLNGGEADMTLAIRYNGTEWNYLCYQADYYHTCYNIHPMLELQIESEIKKDTVDSIQNCFNKVKEDFEDRGYNVGTKEGEGTTFYSVDLLPGYVKINLNKKFYISKDGGGSQDFDDFSTWVSSPIYDLVQVAREIVNSESQFCHFEYNGYMLLYPQYSIKRIDYMGSKIYRLIDRFSGTEFRFAIRSCAFAPGI